jgi:hypothetical protein
MGPSKLPRTLLVFLFVLPLMSALAQVKPPTSLPDIQSIGALATDLFNQSGSTGMVLVVVRDDQVFIRGYGETSPSSHQVGNTLPFNKGSRDGRGGDSSIRSAPSRRQMSPSQSKLFTRCIPLRLLSFLVLSA